MSRRVCNISPRHFGKTFELPSTSTAGLLTSETHIYNQFANEAEGLRDFRDHRWKALGEENPDLSGLFLFRNYFESYIE